VLDDEIDFEREAVTDALAPNVTLPVGVGVLLTVAVAVDVRLCVAVAAAVRVPVTVAVTDALAPRVKLLVGVYDGCGQKHRGSQPLYAGSWQDGEEP
jgi:hypothetical protein